MSCVELRNGVDENDTRENRHVTDQSEEMLVTCSDDVAGNSHSSIVM